MTPTAALQRSSDATLESPLISERRVNPWVSDQVLLGMSLWWVRMTHPESRETGEEVAMVFSSLQQELQ